MSTPRINPNDPKWTAYILGELDEADRASVERLLESSAEARALVNEAEGVGVLPRVTPWHPSHPELLTAAQRAAVHDAADAGRARWFARAASCSDAMELGPWRAAQRSSSPQSCCRKPRPGVVRRASAQRADIAPQVGGTTARRSQACESAGRTSTDAQRRAVGNLESGCGNHADGSIRDASGAACQT
jgi:hypothetical protein